MDLSLCIVSWNVTDDLKNCLESLREGAAGISSEIILVDNASEDDTVDMVRREFPDVQVIANAHNAGFAAANVQAMEQAVGRYLLMLNPDTLVPPGGMAQLIRFADAHPEAGVVGPKLVYGDGRLQHSCRSFPTAGAALFRNTILGRLFPRTSANASYLMENWDHSEVREVDWVSGACLLIRRDAFDQIGPLDTSFYWGSEDVDYCWRTHKAGWKVVYTPEPVITHLVGRSTDKVPIKTLLRHHRSMYQLYSKHMARNPISRFIGWLGVWVRAGLILLQALGQWLCGKLQRLLRGPMSPAGTGK